jgi:hypothetical protein
MSQLYRPSKLGESLVDALETLIKEEKITEGLAMEVMTEVRDRPNSVHFRPHDPRHWPSNMSFRQSLSI